MPKGVYDRNKSTRSKNASVKRKRVKKVIEVAIPTTRGDEMLDLMLKSICEAYPGDATYPGVSLAWLPDSECFYGSIVRYTDQYAKGRIAIHKVMGTSTYDVLHNLLDFWVAKIKAQSEATEALRKEYK